MKCNECLLNSQSDKFDEKLINKVPEELRAFFTCCERDYKQNYAKNADLHKKHIRTAICPKTVWTVVYIGCKDEFALSQAETVFDELVEGGYSELLCSLFENASYNIRRELWLKMAKYHMNKMYLFDALFEREELEPLCSQFDEIGDFVDIHKYQHCILHVGLGFANQRKYG